MALLFTREIDYGLRVLRGLAKEGQCSAAVLAEKEQIPLAFAYKVLKKMAKAELVEIVRGTKGGYRLKCQPEALSLYQIATLLDSDLLITECVSQGYHCKNAPEGGCGIHKEFCRIQAILVEELKRKTCAELL